MTAQNQTYIVYAIKSILHGFIYVGMTNNIERRIKEHNSGYSKYTKAYLPWELIYQETCVNRLEARKREKYWKSGIGKEKLKELL